MTYAMKLSLSAHYIFLEWFKSNINVYTYIFKAVSAALLALGVSMLLQLPDPRTAVFTVFIVMNPQSGLVFSKSYYRILGTIAGVSFSLLIVGALTQEYELFILFSALWIGLATAGGFKYRNFKSYGFILAGYTVTIVAFPALLLPMEAFDIALSRFSEIIVGILCATVVSDVVFPRRLSDSMLGAETNRLSGVLKTLSHPTALFSLQEETKYNLSHFLSGMTGQTAMHTNSSFENINDRKKRFLYQQLNYEFMNLSTTYHSLKSIVSTTEFEVSNNAQRSLCHIYAPIASALKHENLHHDTVAMIIINLANAKSEVASIIIEERKNIPDDLLVLEHLLVRLLKELRIYCITYNSLLRHQESDDKSRDLNQVIRFSYETDNFLVALAALRGILVLVATALFWKLTAWPLAIQTISMAVISQMLFSTLANPINAFVDFFKGSLFALVIAAIVNFFLIPYASDFFSLSLILIVPFAAIGWWTTQPKWVVFSLGFTFMFMFQCALDPSYKIEAVFFFENALASLLGIIFSGTAYLLINFWSYILTQNRVKKVLPKLISQVCINKPIMSRSILESKVRDLIQQLLTQGRLDADSSHLVLDWLLSMLEIGRAAISIRQNLDLPHQLYRKNSVDSLLKELGYFFKKPTQSELNLFLQKLLNSLEILNHNVYLLPIHERKAIEKIIDELSIIKTVMQNKKLLHMITKES